MNQLLLVPTDPEMRILLPKLLGFAADSGCAARSSGDWVAELCGFGQILSAARTAMLIARYQPSSVILAGIAGALDPRLTIGDAYEFERVEVDGVGVGVAIPPGRHVVPRHDGAIATNPSEPVVAPADRVQPDDSESPSHRDPAAAGQPPPACRSTYRSAAAIGWTQWPGSGDSPVIGDSISLRPPDGSEMPATIDVESDRQGLGLLSVCAASADAAQADDRRQRFPAMAAEDMEGFGVAAACRLAGIPLRIVRGISNRAGDRDLSGWQTVTALESVARRLNALMSCTDAGPTHPRATGSAATGVKRA